MSQLYCGNCGRPATQQALCASCAADLKPPERLCSEQIVSLVVTPDRDTGALIDPFGQAHVLGERTVIGRALSGQGINIREGSVSRRHAEVRLSEDQSHALVRDLGSTNGTNLNDAPISDWVRLTPGDRIAFGDIQFFYVDRADGLSDFSGDSPTARVLDSEGIDEQTDVGLPGKKLELLEPRGGGGGFLQVDDHVVPLTVPQLEFMRALCSRMEADTAEPDIVRGYVRSAELLHEISWDTQHPTENHLKQLVVRVRRNLARAGVDNLIESRRRLGYRLRIIPL